MTPLSDVAVESGQSPLTKFARSQQSVRPVISHSAGTPTTRAYSMSFWLLMPCPFSQFGNRRAGHAAAPGHLELLQPGLEARLLNAFANRPLGVWGVLHFSGEIAETETVI
jgi:hypothetical protein